MKKPEIILFDYGHTIGYEDHFDALAGYRALLALASENPRSITAEQLTERNDEMYSYLDRNAHPYDFELHHHIYFRAVLEPLGLKFDIDPVEMEYVYWKTASPIEPMPGAVEIIDYINAAGIRTGVVSNMSFSGAALRRMINDIIPRNRFEFVLASSDYGWRKPQKYIFEAAIAKAGVPSDMIWFCGDNAQADIVGAMNVGMTPVWVQSPKKCYYRDAMNDEPPAGDYFHIRDLRELKELLNNAE